MKFEMWSVWHVLFMLAPFIALTVLWLILRKKSNKTKYVVGVVIGCLSLLCIIARNIDIYVNYGFDPEIIPLQVCHFGNIMVFISLVFRSKIATSVAWTLNLLAAFSSLVVADALVGYETLAAIRPQAYIWGHLLIVVGAVYAVMFKIVRINFKSFLFGLLTIVVLLIPSIILNAYFNNVLLKSVNYFYIFNSNGVPFDFLYNAGKMVYYGWFSINWVYVILLSSSFIAIMFGIYNIQKLFYLKNKNYITYNIFEKKKLSKI